MGEFHDAEVVAYCEVGKKYPRPLRFRFMEAGETIIIRVDRVVEVDVAGAQNDSVCTYKCESVISGKQLIYYLRFRPSGNNWRVSVH